jgi:hypothetical protein
MVQKMARVGVQEDASLSKLRKRDPEISSPRKRAVVCFYFKEGKLKTVKLESKRRSAV